ncbi:MAG: ABC transporter permease, partial [Betaproteobacteria bacterium]|nr:ABC transporter permease [Betaproteobacteria bacterium]
MESLRLALRNAFRHRLRTGLTVLGLVIAIVAFGLLQTVVDAWYAGAEGASNTRLITRNSISLVFPLPINYRDKIRRVPGVTGVSMANWFAGVYITEKNFFPQFAVDPNSYFELYPEYQVPEAELAAFRRDRKGAIIGRKLADIHGFKVGDVVPLRGTIYPGTWSFVVRGIYDGAEKSTDTSQMFFHWDYLNETIKRT